jgi:hypothetical protein
MIVIRKDMSICRELKDGILHILYMTDIYLYAGKLRDG